MNELARLFLRLGSTAFGGPAAHIAMMRGEVVLRRGWVTEPEFVDMLGAVNLIPGPNSTEMAILIGHRRAGWPGLVVAGACFILPSTLIVAAAAWGYVRYGALPQAAGLLEGVKPAVVAIVAQALYGLGRSVLKTPAMAVAAAAATALSLLGVDVLALLFGCGALFAVWRACALRRADGTSRVRGLAALVPAVLGGGGKPGAAAGAWAGVATAAGAVALLPLFLVFLKAGAALFGSGYVLLAFLRADLVQRFHWLTEAQLLDAIAVGQVTPGPVFSTATFIGYVLAGAPGAAVATVGIFLPAFVYVAVSGLLLPRLRGSRVAGSFLDGVNATSLGLMAAVTVELGRSALSGWFPLLIGLVCAVCLFRFRLNATWLILGGAAVGLLARLVRM
ncbi:MAG: chromate efflux transporter [Bryobacteraceae bacterium]